MKEESKKYPGIAARIRRSFAYHYDQIQPETLYQGAEQTINLFKSFIK